MYLNIKIDCKKINLILLEDKHFIYIRNLSSLTLANAASSYIPTPKKLANKKSTINIKNEDQKSFLWSVLSFFNEDQKHNRVTDLQKYSHLVNVRDLEFPVKIEKIPKFESFNEDICINVLSYEDEKDIIYPIFTSKNRGRKHTITLLFLKKQHYILVKNLSRLLSDQTEHHGKVEICPYCLHIFTKTNALANLEKHLELGSLNKCQRVRMPQEGEILKFSNYSYTLKVPYIIYADFECMIIDNIHKPCGYGYLIIDEEGEVYYGPKIVRANSLEESEKLIDNFIDELETHSVILKKKLQTIIDMNFTTEDEKTFTTKILLFMYKTHRFH
ncbi:uncharacterized protein LOC120354661 [Nilaparvata lugens]|uniref:uncharacterized protein LOC120354661 n=1 Tax=Nilaparvata lugens TaxID=108931 RepID=UPI00193D8948|nr:uncharacterized protein LOC120354661 [Nilaparvata lugens]